MPTCQRVRTAGNADNPGPGIGECTCDRTAKAGTCACDNGDAIGDVKLLEGHGFGAPLTWIVSCNLRETLSRQLEFRGELETLVREIFFQPDIGGAGTALRNDVPHSYADGISAPSGETRPSARLVSNLVCAQTEDTPSTRGVTDMFWLWGQFLDHDIDLTGEADPMISPLVLSYRTSMTPRLRPAVLWQRMKTPRMCLQSASSASQMMRVMRCSRSPLPISAWPVERSLIPAVR